MQSTETRCPTPQVFREMLWLSAFKDVVRQLEPDNCEEPLGALAKLAFV